MKNVLMKKTLVAVVVWMASGALVIAQPNILTNGDFEADSEGAVGGGTNVIDTTSITGWRVFGVGDATGTATVTSAAGKSGNGIELVRTGVTGAGADAAFDKDDPLLREVILAEERIYKLTVDARDGGPFGGTPALGLGIQFADLTFNRVSGFDPGADFETFGLTARSDTGGQVSVRFDLAGGADRSVHLDNASLVDVTTGVDRMINGGFENSATNLLNWRFFDLSVAGTASLSSDANSGNQAALLDVQLDPFGDIGLDIDPFRIATLAGEELTLSVASKNVFTVADTRLRVSVAGFDAGGVHVGDFFTELLNPSTGAYEDYAFDFTVPADAYFINVGFRVWDNVSNTWSTGSYLIDDVSVMRVAATLPGDFNKDGSVDGNDFLIWQSGFGQFDPNTNPATMADGDADMDGDVDGDDFLIWQSNFGSAAGNAAVVPEPSSVLLLGVLTLILAFASRWRWSGGFLFRDRL